MKQICICEQTCGCWLDSTYTLCKRQWSYSESLSFMGDNDRTTDSIHLLEVKLVVKTTNTFKLSHKCFQPCCSQLQNWHRATVTLQQIILHSLMGFAKSNYLYALRPIEDALLCYWSAPLFSTSVHSFTCSPSLSYHALFDMHSEAACILNVCPSNTYTQVLV